MPSETSPLIDDNDGQLYDEDGYSLYSENTMRQQKLKEKVLYVLAMMIIIPFVWYVVFYLPNTIPSATSIPLDVSKVDSIPVYLHPIVAKSKSLDNGIDAVFLSNGEEYVEMDATILKSKKLVRRIILIGDIHGSYRELSKLMKKLKVNHNKDYVLLLGDFISKGPDSMLVLNWAISNKVGCVLGNHEVYILNRYAQFHSLRKPEFLSNSTAFENDFTTKEFYDLDDEMKIAKNLRSEQVEYLINCPLIHQLGPVAHTNKKQTVYKDSQPTEGIAVHAGLQWSIPNLQDQDPETVVSIRSLLAPDFTVPTDDPHTDGAESWAKHWNKYQKQNKDKSSTHQKVFYGHNARKGLDNREFSVGLDTGCVTGGELSALVLWAEVKKNKLVYRDSVYQVACN